MKRVAGIIGYPAGHSLSPSFQRAALAAAGLEASYEIWETRPEELARRFEGLRDPLCLGANVTIPYKEDAAELVDELAPEAELAGAVNTVVNDAGRLNGFNTDGPGFVRALRAQGGFEPEGRTVLLLGAGGAARGIAFGLAQAGAGTIVIVNRTPGRAEALARDLERSGASSRALVAPVGEAASEFDCIVNCTSLGMAGGGAPNLLPLEPSRARQGTLIVDIVYVPEVTPFLARAKEAGLPVLGGLPMLIQQGGLAFQLWTGREPPLEVMFGAARRELERRRTASEGAESAR